MQLSHHERNLLCLAKCYEAVQSADVATARGVLVDALGLANKAPASALVLYWLEMILNKSTSDQCGFFFDVLAEKGFSSELELVTPYRIAMEYWQSGKGPEILDRLNPELRDIVEEIIDGKAASTSTPKREERTA